MQQPTNTSSWPITRVAPPSAVYFEYAMVSMYSGVDGETGAVLFVCEWWAPEFALQLNGLLCLFLQFLRVLEQITFKRSS